MRDINRLLVVSTVKIFWSGVELIKMKWLSSVENGVDNFCSILCHRGLTQIMNGLNYIQGHYLQTMD